MIARFTVITLTILVIGQIAVARNSRRAGSRGTDAGMAGMITDQNAYGHGTG